jgi:hypothetical protein
VKLINTTKQKEQALRTDQAKWQKHKKNFERSDLSRSYENLVKEKSLSVSKRREQIPSGNKNTGNEKYK